MAGSWDHDRVLAPSMAGMSALSAAMYNLWAAIAASINS
jgi:hypothetical protein